MTVDDETQENPAPKPAPRQGPDLVRRPAPTAAAPVPSAPHCDPRKFGRVDDDGTVWLISSAGERVIGSWQAGEPDAAFATSAKRYDGLATGSP